MIHRSADDWQAHADVYAFIKGQQLHRNVTLVMIHSDNNIELAFDRAQEDRIGRLRVRDVQATCSRRLYRGQHLARFLVAKQPAFPGVRVEPRHRDARAGDAQRARRTVGQVDNLLYPGLRHPTNGFFQRDVRGDVHHAQARPGQKHAHLLRAGALGQQLGMAGKMETGQVHSRLVERGRHHRIHLPLHRQITRPVDVLHRGPSRRSGNHPRRAVSRVGIAHVQQRNGARAVSAGAGVHDLLKIQGSTAKPFRGPLQDPRIANHQRASCIKDILMRKGFENNLWSYPGRVAQSNCQQGFGW